MFECKLENSPFQLSISHQFQILIKYHKNILDFYSIKSQSLIFSTSLENSNDAIVSAKIDYQNFLVCNAVTSTGMFYELDITDGTVVNKYQVIGEGSVVKVFWHYASQENKYVFLCQNPSRTCFFFVIALKKNDKIHSQKRDITIEINRGSQYVSTLMGYSSGIIFLAKAESTGIHRIFIKPRREDTIFLKGKYDKVVHLSGNRKYSRLAIGTTDGAVLLFSDVHLEFGAWITRKFHWHTFPVLTLEWSFNGSVIYSGGQESVLIICNFSANTENKQFLPRLGAPISAIMPSIDGSSLATQHLDGTIRFISASLKVVTTIAGFINGSYITPKIFRKFPGRLKYDSNSQALVMNGIQGHLQFYIPTTRQCKFQLNVSGINIISPDCIEEEIPYYSIVSFGFYNDWLFTYETASEYEMQSVFRFWLLNKSTNTYALKLVFTREHSDVDGKVISNSPNKFCNCFPSVCLIFDKNLELWQMTDNEWRFKGTCDFQEMSVSNAVFSEDATVLVVTYENVLTIWNTQKLDFPLNVLASKTKIKDVCFGLCGSFTTLAFITDLAINFLDIKSGTLLKCCEGIYTELCVEPHSGIFSCLKQELNEMFIMFYDVNIFSNNVDDRSFLLSNLSSPLKITFGNCTVSKVVDSFDSWLENMIVYAMNDDWELFSFQHSSRRDNDVYQIDDSDLTIFNTRNSFAIQERTFKPKLRLIDKKSLLSMMKLFEIPSHTFANTDIICKDVQTTALKLLTNQSVTVDEEMDVSESAVISNDEDNLQTRKTELKKSKIPSKLDCNYSFLLDLFKESTVK